MHWGWENCGNGYNQSTEIQCYIQTITFIKANALMNEVQSDYSELDLQKKIKSEIKLIFTRRID